MIADALDAVVAAFPSVEIGSYPYVDALEYKVKITLDVSAVRVDVPMRSATFPCAP